MALSRVLAITRRTAQLCGTQELLHASGLELVAANSMAAANSEIKAKAVKGVIVCMHSWSEPEREKIALELETKHPGLSVIVRCPGCDLSAGKPGVLGDAQPVKCLVSKLASSPDTQP